MDLNELTIRKEPFTAMNEISDFKDARKASNLSLKKWYRQFRDCDCTYYYNPRDKRPFFYAIKEKLLGTIKRAQH